MKGWFQWRRFWLVLIVSIIAWSGSCTYLYGRQVNMTGSGTEADPFVIWDVNDLQDINLDLTAYYELGQDIDASATVGWNAGAGFIPVGKWVQVYYPLPDGDHSSGGAWTIFPADGVMYTKVDDRPHDSDATYIQATANDSWVLFTVTPDIPLIVGSTINYVQVRAARKQIGAGTSSIQGYLRIGGINYLIGSPLTSGPSYGDSGWYAYTNPATGLPWTQSEVNSIEAFGVYVADASPNVRVTSVYLRVSQELYFKGKFNGKGHTISGLYINRPTEDCIALFGDTLGAVIENVGLLNVDITGAADVAALVGDSEGNTSINNCYSTGVVTGAPDAYDVAGLVGDNRSGSKIENSYSTCHVSVHGGDPYDIGGLVGDNGGDIINSYCTGDVDVSGDHLYDIGGLAGDQGPNSIIGCHATGNINITANLDLSDCGGLVGDNNGTINNSYAAGNLTITLNAPNGYDFGGFTGDNSGSIDQSFSTGIITVRVTAPGAGTGIEWVGGFTGDNSGHVINCYSLSNVVADNIFGGVWNEHIGGFAGDNSDIINNCYWAGILTVSVGFANVGGFLGEDTGTTTSCFWDIETSGWLTSAGGTGKTTTEMKNIDTFKNAGWDIELTTELDPTYGYPFLSWQLGTSPIWLIFGIPPTPLKDYSLVQQELLELLRR